LWCEDGEPAASSLLSHRQIWEIPKDAEEGERGLRALRAGEEKWREGSGKEGKA